jgi:Domain of unknown function (DUF4189)
MKPAVCRGGANRGKPCLTIFGMVAFLILTATSARADCLSGCRDDYYACLHTGSVGNCSHRRSMCSQSCTLSGGNAALYGAIAYSPSTGVWGTAARHGSQAAAIQRALHECRNRGGGADCMSDPLWFRSPNCGALAGEQGNGALRHAGSREGANRSAIAACRQRGSAPCAVKDAVCATDRLE